MIVRTLRLQFEGASAMGQWLAVGSEGIQESADRAINQQIAPCLLLRWWLARCHKYSHRVCAH
jgi:hypothetical protein